MAAASGAGWSGPAGFDSIWMKIASNFAWLVWTRRTKTSPARPTCCGPRCRCRLGSRGPARSPPTTALALGLVGPAARACGLDRDVRQDFPSGIFRFAQLPISSWTTGDVFARAYVRWLEIQRSVGFIKEQLQAFPAGPVQADAGPWPLKPNHIVVSLVEGWRGEICHVALTDLQGRFSRYKIVDPSFHNWTGLAMALRDQQISDFPLCNKSFNLSYCGHDL